MIEYALQLAQRSRIHCPPNPAVGCVIVAADGAILGDGHTQAVGGPHAEIMALRDAQAKGHTVRGATAFVTLEPCSHHGRTGPCCDALINAGIQKVVASVQDPNPLVAGQGFARLRAAGIEVEVGPSANESIELNIGFFKRMAQQAPWMRMKTAASLDGRTALDNGVSQWITSEAARADGHLWRARACCVLTGIGTVLADDPRLDARALTMQRQPHLAIVDSRLETPIDAQLFAVPRKVFIYTAIQDSPQRSVLEAHGATVIVCPNFAAGKPGQVDLTQMCQDLCQREINEIHVEAGYRLHGALLKLGLVDEILVYVAPKLLGTGRGIAELGSLTSLDAAQSLAFHAVERIGPDLRILARFNASLGLPTPHRA